MNYSFDRDYRFKNLRFTVKAGEEVQSISCIYWNAFLYENEIHDLSAFHYQYRDRLSGNPLPHPCSHSLRAAGKARGAKGQRRTTLVMMKKRIEAWAWGERRK